MGKIITLTMAMRHCRRAIAAWPLSFKSQPIRAVIPIAFDRSTSGRSFFFKRQRRRVSALSRG